MLDQSIIDKMSIGGIDDTLLEDTTMAFVDSIIEDEEEAEHSLMAESSLYDTIDHILDL